MPSVGNTDASELKVVNSPGYTDGQVWQGFRKHWVYESGVTYTGVDGSGYVPYVPQVYVGGILQSSGYFINYELGQVIFNTAISTSSTVQAQHSFKNVQVYIGDDLPWWQELQFRSWDVDDDHWQLTDRGDWSVGGNHRVQMPLVIINATARGDTPPFALGNYHSKRRQDVKFHVLAEDKATRDNLTDLILNQSEKTIVLFDIDQAMVDQKIPLDCNGRLVGRPYPYLIDNYGWAYARASDGYIAEIESIHNGLYEGMVKITYSVIFSDIT